MKENTDTHHVIILGNTNENVLTTLGVDMIWENINTNFLGVTNNDALKFEKQVSNIFQGQQKIKSLDRLEWFLSFGKKKCPV